ncbi:Ubiquitin-like protein [Entomophthora muscae]|uniref:Ubiquitin-like protein n=1 Tax=Entomophthora muscae TaxID=34485 RepID=A0ACC2U3B5_9FUNG|nr:Ubiquitin-like protein [Entomophthora muscae]
MDLPKELHSERSLEAEEINSPLSPVKNELIQRPSSSNLGSTVENQTRDAEKVIVRFRAVGNAPIMKRNHYNIKTTFKFRALTNFLRKELGYKSSESLFLYVNSSFAPSPDESVSNLFKCFQVDNQLIINYCTSQAWG